MTSRTPHITVRAIQPVLAGLERIGIDVDVLLEAVGLRSEALSDPEGRVAHTMMMELWERALELSGDAHLGIHLAERAPIHSFGVHAYAVLSSPTLRAGYERACRYQRLIHEVTDLSLTEGDGGGVLHHALPGGRPVPRHPAEFLVTLWVRFGRLLTAEHWNPARVLFAHDPPADTSEHTRIFGRNVSFSTGRNEMHLSAEQLDARNPTADVGTATALDRHADELLQLAPDHLPVATRVRELLARELRGGAPTAGEMAASLHMSERTMQRRLADLGTTYGELLDQVRHERAARLLSNPAVSIAEIGFLLGYSELGSFYRAFKRWTGRTPAAVRERLLRDDS